jgi:hypothetical protein
MLHEDDYVGSCPMCGGNMSNVSSGHADPLAMRYAQQLGRIRSAPDESGLHSMMRRGDFGNLIDENLLAVSKDFLIEKKKA